jgi:hypothetical protein
MTHRRRWASARKFSGGELSGGELSRDGLDGSIIAKGLTSKSAPHGEWSHSYPNFNVMVAQVDHDQTPLIIVICTVYTVARELHWGGRGDFPFRRYEMMRGSIIVVTLLLLVSGNPVSAAEGRTKALSDYRPRVLLRASKIGYHRHNALIKSRAGTMGDIHGRLICSDGSAVRFAGKSTATYASWKNAESYINAQNDPVRARQNVAYHEKRIREVDALLASLPQEATKGFRLGKLWGNKWLERQYEPQLREKMQSIAHAVDALHGARIAEHAGKMQTIERQMQQRMDQLYVLQQPQIVERMNEMSGQQLYAHAISLLHKIDAMTHSKTIRRETVEKGRSSSRSHSHSTSRSRSVEYGSFGRVKAASRSDGASYASKSSQSSHQRDQLLLDAASYTVKVRNLNDRRTDDKALTPVEARMLVGMILETNEVTRALEKRDPALAKILSGWLEHSQVAFNVPTAYYSRGQKANKGVTVQMGHAHRDVMQLQALGVITRGFARHLDGKLKRPMASMLEMGSSLLTP